MITVYKDKRNPFIYKFVSSARTRFLGKVNRCMLHLMSSGFSFVFNDLWAALHCRAASTRRALYHSALAVLALSLSVAVVTPASAAGESPQPSFFNTVEVRSKNLSPFKKWLSALNRYSKEAKAPTKVPCPPGDALHICSYDDWIAFLKTLEDKAPLVQLNEVNNRINQAKYITDSANWGQNDYWATPAEFMARFGDCEDYAILKYLSLRRLGWKESTLRVVAVKDLNLKVGHAVLIVFFKHPKNGQILQLLLDNQIKSIANAASIRHYQPVFSINKYFWWRHTPVTG